jgi:hypothetical protein
VLNVTGPETASVRRIAEDLGGKATGAEAPTALLSDATKCHRLFGYPDVTLGTLIQWQDRWLDAQMG